jgi:hypothetical protein
MSYPNLHLLLHAANRRRVFVALGRTLLSTLGVLLLAILIAVALDAAFAFPVPLLITLDLMLLALLLMGATLLLRTVRDGRFCPRRIARIIEQRSGLTSSALINALDLRDAQQAGFSLALARKSVERGEQTARAIDLSNVVETRPLARAALACGLAAMLLAMLYFLVPDVLGRGLPRLFDPTGDHPPFTLLKFQVAIEPEPLYYGSDAKIAVQLHGPTIPDRADLVMLVDGKKQRSPMISVEEGYELTVRDATVSRDFYVDTPEGRSDWYRLDVREVPQFEEVWVAYAYPEHTDWPPRRYPLQGRDIEAMVGTQVTVEVKSNFPLKHVQARLYDESGNSEPSRLVTLTPDQNEPRRAQGSFSLDFSGRVTLELIGHNGVPGSELREARLIATRDEPPRVQLAAPEPTALAVEGWKVPVQIEAADDIEVRDLSLHFSRNGQASENVPLENQSPDRRRGRAEYELDLAKIEAKPGDEIRVFASASDNHPNPSQTADSATHVIQVISQEEYAEYMRTMYQMDSLQQEIEQLQQQLDQQTDQAEAAEQALRELAEQLEADKPLNEAQQTQLDQAQQQLDQAQAKTSELQEQLRERLEQPQLYDVEKPYRERLQQLSDQLAEQQEAMSQTQQALDAVQQQPAPTPQDVERLQQAIEQMQQQQNAAESNEGDKTPSLEQIQQQAEKLQLAQRMMAEAQRIQQVMQQQREIADRLQPLREQPSLTPEQQSRADRLAREQELLDQQLREATESLKQAADQAKEQLPKTAKDAQAMCDAIGQMNVGADQQQCASAARQGNGDQAHQAADRAAEKLESLAGQCPNPQGIPQNELDAGLGLSRESLQQTLQQLAQGQGQKPNLPRMGHKPGQAGQGGERGRDPSSRFGLHGPQPPRDDAFTGRRQGNMDESREGQDTRQDDAAWAAAEQISADARQDAWGRAGNLRGVPVGYRDQAEAYFRRLSEQSATP